MILLTWQYNPVQTGFSHPYEGRKLYGGRGCGHLPSANVIEDEDNYKLEIAAPGFEKEDFHIRVENNRLNISTDRKDGSERKDNYMRREFGFMDFSRSFTLTESIATDAISAGYKNGILTVTLPKKEEAKLRKEIQIA
jgi:HSP20 family protein